MNLVRRSTRWHGIPILIGGALLAVALNVSAAAAVTPYTLTIYIGGSCIYTQGPASDTFTLHVRDRVGRLVVNRTGHTNSSGYGDTCMPRSIQLYDHVTLTNANQTHSLVVPLLTVKVDRVANVVHGNATPGAHVTVQGYHYPTYSNSTAFGPVVATAGTSGAWSVDFSGIMDFIGSDYFDNSVTTAAGDVIYRDLDASFMSVYGSTNYVYGYASSGQPITIKLSNPSGQPKGIAADVAQPNGFFGGYFLDAKGAATYPIAGDKVKGMFATDALLTMPQTSLHGTASNDQITARCLPHRPFQAYSYNDSGYSYQFGTTDASGSLTVDMSSGSYASFNLQAGDYIQVRCKTAKGDEVELDGKAKP
jgi:hypothetical protein